MTAPATGTRAGLIAEAAARLRAAALTATPCAPVRDLIGADDGDAAYAVQRTLADARVRAGARVVGHKIGLTAAAVQRQLGVDRPDFGLLFDDMSVAGNGPIDVRRLLQPRIEAEIAFVLATDITDPDADVVTVAAAVAYACAALEIVDSRIAGWNIRFADTVADNASSALYVLSATRRTLQEFTPADTTMTMTLDADVVSSGDGRECLGDPLNALAWLARTAIATGDPLRAGQLVLSGALGPMVTVTPGAVFRAEISALGRVEAAFTTGDKT